jgi:putative PIN family toxin of toxin-antitoxin system
MRTIRVVLDTNVVVSAHLNFEGYERGVLDLALSGKLRMFISEAILREYESVLRRPKFRMKPRSVSHSLLLLRAAARVVAPYGHINVARDPGDNRFLECCGSGKGGLPDHRQQTSFPQAMATDADCECTGVVGVDDSRDALTWA